ALAVDAVHQLERRPRQLGHGLAGRHPDRGAAERGDERRVAVHDQVRRAVVERGRAGAGGPDRRGDGIARAASPWRVPLPSTRPPTSTVSSGPVRTWSTDPIPWWISSGLPSSPPIITA